MFLTAIRSIECHGANWERWRGCALSGGIITCQKSGRLKNHQGYGILSISPIMALRLARVLGVQVELVQRDKGCLCHRFSLLFWFSAKRSSARRSRSPAPAPAASQVRPDREGGGQWKPGGGSTARRDGPRGSARARSCTSERSPATPAVGSAEGRVDRVFHCWGETAERLSPSGRQSRPPLGRPHLSLTGKNGHPQERKPASFGKDLPPAP